MSNTAITTIAVNQANDAPTTINTSIQIDEDELYTFKYDPDNPTDPDKSDFAFFDVDSGDTLDHIIVTALPSPEQGVLMLNGDVVVLGQKIYVSEITGPDDDETGLQFLYSPDENAAGDNFTAFSFKVNDGDASSAEAGVFTFNVTPIADIPNLSLEVGTTPVTVSPYTATLISAQNVYEADSAYTISTIHFDANGTRILTEGTDEVITGKVDEIPDNEGGVNYFSIGGENDGPDWQIGWNSNGEPDADNDGVGDGTNTGASELFIIKVDEGVDLTEITVNYKYLAQDDGGTYGDEVGTYELYLDDVFVDSGTFDATTYGVGGSVTISSGSKNSPNLFDEIRIGAAENTTDGTGTSDFAIVSIFYEQNDDNISEVTHTYEVDLSASLNDTDGSETLSIVTVTGIPEGTIFTTDGDPDGVNTIGTLQSGPDVDGFYTWNFTAAEYGGAGGTTFYMSIPGEDSNGNEITSFSLEASVIADEDDGGNVISTDSADGSVGPIPVPVPPLDEVLGIAKADNGWGNGDDNAPGGSGGNNNAENRIEVVNGANNADDILYGTYTPIDDPNNVKDGNYQEEYARQDFMLGKGGNDTIYGEAEDQPDTITNDYIDGGADNDLLFGQGGNDYIIGGTGNDEITGGAGDDEMFGGGGDDTFIFQSGIEGQDTVDGGAAGGWTDAIDLSALNSNEFEDGWTLVLDNGGTYTEAGHDVLMDQDDTSGKIEFTGGGTITFENVEKITW